MTPNQFHSSVHREGVTTSLITFRYISTVEQLVEYLLSLNNMASSLPRVLCIDQLNFYTRQIQVRVLGLTSAHIILVFAKFGFLFLRDCWQVVVDLLLEYFSTNIFRSCSVKGWITRQVFFGWLWSACFQSYHSRSALKGWMTRQIFLVYQNQCVSKPTWVE